MQVEEAFGLISQNLLTDPGRFYCSPTGLPLGAGLILSGVRYPSYDPEQRLYATLRGTIVVLSHECDIDQGNNRPFNHLALVAPLIDFANYVAEWTEGDEALNAFLGNLGHRLVSRVTYVPYCREDFFPYGAIIYLNDLASVPVTELEQADIVREASLRQYGLNEVDKMIEAHFLRPKVVELP